MLFRSLYTISSDHLKKTIADDSKRQAALDACHDVLIYQAGLRFELTDDIKLVESKIIETNHDVLDWVERECQGMPKQLPDGQAIRYEFYLDDEQKDFLKKRLEQFQTKNLNMALRKLSEYLGAKYMLFKVRKAQ